MVTAHGPGRSRLRFGSEDGEAKPSLAAPSNAAPAELSLAL